MKAWAAVEQGKERARESKWRTDASTGSSNDGEAVEDGDDNDGDEIEGELELENGTRTFQVGGVPIRSQSRACQ